MAGYTDSAYRQIVKSIAPETICFSELTSINALEKGSKKTERMLEYNPIEQPLIIQLFGKDPDFFKEAGKKLEKTNIAGIDINMGCPAKKVIGSECGSALLNDTALAGEIVKKLSTAVKIPISVKMRIGYKQYDKEHFIKFIKTLEESGISSLTIHGRTTKQGYSGEANWDPIYLAKSILKIPVIGNGDVDSPQKALERLTSPDGKTTLDGIMIGRATIGNPWLLQEIQQTLTTKTISPSTASASPSTQPTELHHEQIPLSEKIPTIKKHLKLSLKNQGPKIGILEMRKHLAGYVQGFPGARELRSKLVRAGSEQEILELLKEVES